MSSTLYEVFADTAERRPDAPAVELPERSLTYRELGQAADVVAQRIREVRPAAARVGLLARRSTVAFAGYLAALRLGAAVVPLNPEHPDDRLARIRAQAAVDVVVADAAIRGRDHAWASGLPVLTLADDDVLGAAPNGTLPPYRPDPDATAYVLFTSGTTGRPKGMPLRHRHVLPFVRECITRYGVAPGCRMSHTFDLTFDPSVYDLFVTWGGGAVLVVPDRGEMFSPVDYAAGRALTHWFSVPSAISVSIELGRLPVGPTTEATRSGPVTALRYSVFGGEQFTLDQARVWHAVAPHSLIDNAYGPSEAAIACAAYRLPRDPAHWPRTSNGTVPIGQVFDHLEALRDVDTSELCVRGPQRFDGYVDPRDDSGRFLGPVDGGRPEPEHFFRTGDRVGLEGGQFVHLGRLDDQVKVRGLRVEPGDVEAALRRLPQIHDAVVSAVRRGDIAELVACYTGEAVSPHDLVRALRAWLPVHLVPRRFLHLAALPLNGNGKADRQALRALADRAAHARTPRTPPRPTEPGATT
ncbi:AMP-binding protein [Streptomyces sp. NPDC002742]|uniref:AMP-binding protein n=1 Tax=Streptomyces sp. NPDC002742 TaxID=3364663 RepID=UPI003683A9CA